MTQVLDCIEICMEAVASVFYPRTLLSMALLEYSFLCSYNKYFYSTELQREILHFLHHCIYLTAACDINIYI